MIGTYSSEAIERFFLEKAEIFRTEGHNGGVLVYWTGAQSIPTMRAVSLFESGTGNEFIPNISDETFLSFFDRLKPEVQDAGRICYLLEWASPYLRKAITKPAAYLENVLTVWHAPFVGEDSQFEGYFNNSNKGVVEKIVLSADFCLSIEEVCKGIKI